MEEEKLKKTRPKVIARCPLHTKSHNASGGPSQRPRCSIVNLVIPPPFRAKPPFYFHPSNIALSVVSCQRSMPKGASSANAVGCVVSSECAFPWRPGFPATSSPTHAERKIMLLNQVETKHAVCQVEGLSRSTAVAGASCQQRRAGIAEPRIKASRPLGQSRRPKDIVGHHRFISRHVLVPQAGLATIA